MAMASGLIVVAKYRWFLSQPECSNRFRGLFIEPGVRRGGRFSEDLRPVLAIFKTPQVTQPFNPPAGRPVPPPSCGQTRGRTGLKRVLSSLLGWGADGVL